MRHLLRFSSLLGLVIFVSGIDRSSENLLLNGDFELRGFQPPNTPIPPGDHWEKLEDEEPDSGDEFQLKYNGNDITPPGGAQEGFNYGTAATVVNNADDEYIARAVQRNVPVVPGAQVVLTGFMFGCSNGGTGDHAYDHRALIWNGTADLQGTPLAVFVLEKDDHCSTTRWIPFSLTAVPTDATVVIEWGYREGSDNEWATPTTHVDQLELVATISCHDPFADFDGDGDVDHSDFSVIQGCISGEDEPVRAGCGCADADFAIPFDVDSEDLDRFEACASGPGVPADPACDD